MLRGDQRGVSTLIGAVLLFAILITAMTIYQAEVIPQSNHQVEYQHNQHVQDQLQAVRDKIIEASATGMVQSASINLGPTYEPRTFFVNPPPPTGYLQTVGTTNPAINITVGNVTATDPETADAWTGAQNFSTGLLKFSPNYYRYDRAPTTIYENTVVYNVFETANLSLTDQALVQGNRITLIALNGSLDRASSATTTLTITPVSTSTNTIAITGNGSGPLTITIPTYLPKNASKGTSWKSLLKEQITSGHVRDLSVQDGPGKFSLVTIALDPNETYTLRMAKVGIGSGVTNPPATYITAVERPHGSVEANTTHSITAEVRDRYNNPIRGFLVNATASKGSFNSNQVRTDADGEVTFQYTAPDADTTDTVTLSILNNSSARQRMQFPLEVNAVPSGSGDQSGPTVTSVSTNTSSATQGNSFNLTATISDRGRGGSDIIDVEWFSNRSTPKGGLDSGYAMTATDGQFDQPREAVENLTIDTSGWTTGWHTLLVRGKDGNNNWGPLNTTTIKITTGNNVLKSLDSEARVEGNSGKAWFTLKNKGTKDVEIVAIAFNDTNSSASQLNSGGYVEISTTAGSTLLDTNSNLGFNQRHNFDNNQTLVPGQEVEFYLNKFDNGMKGHSLKFTVYLSDGTQRTFTIVFPL
jgi:hypothetical protein